jgi:asparagine synthase (glutamine-hydrolysing)
MCGIFGAVTQTPRPDLGTLGFTLGSMLRHRGPDDHGWLVAGPDGVRHGQHRPEQPAGDIFLMQQRLSILDLSEAGRQPMSHSRRWHLIYNGEIYNYIELRSELQKLGHVFHTATDTEVLLHAFIEWDHAALTRLVGMFAFALLDHEQGRLFLARDFFGIKPLYYTRPAGDIVFASELKALLGWPGVRRCVEPRRLYEYLRFGQTDHGGATLLTSVRQVPPGHFLDLRRDQRWAGEPEPYWRLTVAEPLDLSLDDAAQHVRELFLDNVRLHLRSDVPVGAALSGGIDSSAILVAMRVAEPKLELHAFSYVADRVDLSEERWSDAAAQRAGAILHKIRVRPGELLDDIDRLIQVQDEPFGGTSIYAQYRVFRAAREHGIPVMLDGQGADEMLAGYRMYFVTRLAALVRRGGLGRAWRFWQAAGAAPGVGGRTRLAAQCLGTLLPSRLRRLGMAATGRAVMPAWVTRSWFEQHGVAPRAMLRRPARSLGEHLEQTLCETSLPMLLRYEDRNSMAYSIESRVPFLTVPLASFLLRLPDEYLISRDGTTKNVFRHAMRGLVPDDVLDRRDKIGFATPEPDWLRDLAPWVEKTLASDRARGIPALNPGVMQTEWRQMRDGTRTLDTRVWRWVNLIRWADQLDVEFA